MTSTNPHELIKNVQTITFVNPGIVEDIQMPTSRCSSFRLWKDFVAYLNNTIVEGSLENVEALPEDRFAFLSV